MLNSFFHQFDHCINLDHVRKDTAQINRRDRSLCYTDFAKTAEYCRRRLVELGMDEVETIPLRCDGRTAYLDAVMPRAWELTGRSFVRITSPDTGDPMLADTAVLLNSAQIWSPPTPPGGLDAELLDLARLDGDFSKARGKVIVVTGPLWTVYTRLAEAGAAGIIHADPGCGECPDDIHWTNAIGHAGWYPTADDPVLPLWFMTPRKYHLFRTLAEKGPVMIHAEMHTRLYSGTLHSVSGLLAGKSPEEIVILAHLYEPFGGDNAVSAAAMLEIMRILKLRQTAGLLQKSIRVIFSMEYFGFAQYFEDRSRTDRILCVLNLDSFCHQTVRRAGIPVRLNCSPITAPFFGDWILRELINRFADVPFEEHYGTLSDDNFASDPKIGIPSVLLFTPPGKYHHNTNEIFNEPDWELCPVMMQIFTVWLALLASDPGELSWLTELLLQNAERDLERDTPCPQFMLDFIRKKLLSLNLFWPNQFQKAMLPSALSPQNNALKQQSVNRCSPIYLRTDQWLPMSLKAVPRKQRKQWTEIENLYLCIALCNGSNSLDDILAILEFLEKAPLSAGRKLELEDYLEYLCSIGYLKKSPDSEIIRHP